MLSPTSHMNSSHTKCSRKPSITQRVHLKFNGTWNFQRERQKKAFKEMKQKCLWHYHLHNISYKHPLKSSLFISLFFWMKKISFDKCWKREVNWQDILLCILPLLLFLYRNCIMLLEIWIRRERRKKTFIFFSVRRVVHKWCFCHHC